jgi:hypothetical protein
MIMGFAYAEVPAIVRRYESPFSSPAHGAEGQTVDLQIKKIMRALALSAQWKAVGDRVIVRDDETEGIDALNLKRVPPKQSYLVHADLIEIRRGEPRRYDFSGLFEDEDEAE